MRQNNSCMIFCETLEYISLSVNVSRGRSPRETFTSREKSCNNYIMCLTIILSQQNTENRNPTKRSQDSRTKTLHVQYLFIVGMSHKMIYIEHVFCVLVAYSV